MSQVGRDAEVTFSVSPSPEAVAEISQLAQEYDLPRSEVIRQLIRIGLEEV